MHIFFSGIGGTGIGPLALIAKQAGYDVSGSDKQDSQYISYLKSKGIHDISIGQTRAQIEYTHKKNPIDWYVYSSAVAIENPNSEELQFCRDSAIKTSKRDQLLNFILDQKSLKLIAVAGTHGKSTTTAMIVWLFKSIDEPVSFSVGAKVSFGEMGEYHPNASYFVYETDEFDRNFLSFEPFLSVITGVSWDHHEIFPTRDDYMQAFIEFITQSYHSLIWEEDKKYLGLFNSAALTTLDTDNELIPRIKLPGHFNRLDALLAAKAVHMLTRASMESLIEAINKFPGLSRRMEPIAKNLYSDYAHTPEKIRAAMSVSLELAHPKNQKVVIVYEPLTNRRQKYILSEYRDAFNGASKIYWVDSYLAREDPKDPILTPEQLISHLGDPSIAEPAHMDEHLEGKVRNHLAAGDMVVCISGGGGNSLDEWIRKRFKETND